MKGILFILILIISFFGYNQEGYDYIRKAERKIEAGKVDQALILLDKADSAEYGFCGNAWIEAREAIALNRVKIAALEEDPIKAAKIVWNITDLYSVRYDSLKITSLIQAYGREEVKKGIDEVLDSFVLDPSVFSLLADLKVQFSFNDDYYFIQIGEVIDNYYGEKFALREDRNTFNRELFQAKFREESFYQLLLEEDQSKN
ncbi:hypothetical protein N9Y60_00135 [Crocinitomicaceae bacterium]|nr:hypothetical protein [Crocinitomicaceae bacterium]MDB3906804.1 hypothetical protein [Crocinitomicaceae bacterium]